MKKTNIHSQLHFYLSMLIAFLLPLAHFVPIAIALLLINWIVEGNFYEKFLRLKESRIALLFISFYLLHLIGMLYTVNIASGCFDVQVKLSLLIFPLIFVGRPLLPQQLNAVFKAFLAGGILSSLLLLLHAIYVYIRSGENTFFYEAFTNHVIHPSYLAMYLNMLLCWLLLQLKNKEAVFGRYTRALATIIIIFIVFILVLLSSKLGLLTMLLIFMYVLVSYGLKNYKAGLLGLSIFFIAVISVIKFVPAVSGRIQIALQAVASDKADNTNEESTAVRMLIWKACNKVIADNFLLGAGTGDAKDELLKEYERRGMTGAIKNKLNAHNEFYQVLVSLGIIGFAVFLFQLLIPLVVAVRQQQVVYICFLLIVILNFLTESMLEAEAGVIYYAFFNSVLCFSFMQSKKS